MVNPLRTRLIQLRIELDHIIMELPTQDMPPKEAADGVDSHLGKLETICDNCTVTKFECVHGKYYRTRTTTSCDYHRTRGPHNQI